MKTAKKPTKNELRLAGVVLAVAVGPEDLATLALDGSFATFAAYLKGEASALRESRRKKAAARVPLVAPRYAKTLAQGILAMLAAHVAAKTQPAPWASLAQPALHAAYMAGSVPTLSTHDAHPGSRAGVVMVDLRKPEEFSTAAGELTFASVLARVTGEPRP